MTGLIYALSSGAGPASRSGGGAAADTSPRDAAAAGSDALRPPSALAERFFLGGTDSVRGFAYRGMGPSAERPRGRPARDDAAGGAGAAAPDRTHDALGGDLFASAYVGLVSRLPGQLGDIGGCAHAFVNGGSASLLSAPAAAGGGDAAAPVAAALLGSLGGAARRRLTELAATCRWSTGVGLVLPTPFGRFEANYVWTLSTQPGDIPKSGLQFGFASSPIAPAGPM